MRREAEGVLAAHRSKVHAVAWIESYLPSESAGLALQDAKVWRSLLMVILWQFELAGWLSRLGHDLLMVREVGLTTAAGIVRMFDLFWRAGARFRPLRIRVAGQ